MHFVTVHKQESHGIDGYFGLEIKVAAAKLPDLEQDSIRRAIYSADKLIESAIREAITAVDPKTPIETANNRKLIDIFEAPIFVEEIGNGYCNDWCCKHLPWFVVTTKVGRFIIGWRKRVISIDWDETVGTKPAEDIFGSEDTTKGFKSIHAWSTEDAKRYIAAIISSASKVKV